MDKVIGFLVLLCCSATAGVGIVLTNRVVKKMEKDDAENSEKAKKETEESFKKIMKSLVKEMVHEEMGFRKSRHGNNARY